MAPDILKNLNNEHDSANSDEPQLNTPITYIGLRERLIQARKKFLAPNDDKNNKDGKDDEKKKKQKKSFDSYDVARILTQECNFCMFRHSSTARLATYDVEKGIYTFDFSLLRRYISYVAPRFNNSRANDVIYHLTNMIGDYSVVKPFDNPNLVPVGNGIYEPSTNTLYPFKPSKFITGKIATCLPYKNRNGKLTIQRVTEPVTAAQPKPPKIANIDGSSWEFNGWLMSIANNDKEIYQLLWQVIAVACNANRQMGKGIFLLGRQNGNNGKGTFQTLIQNLVGEKNYAMKKINQFSERFALEDLVDVSVVIGDDNPVNVVIKDKSNFNSIITNDPVSVEPKGEKRFTEKLNLTVIQSCNAMPRFSDDGGVYRRMLIVPFNADFNGTGENKAIKEQYLAKQDVLQYVLYTALQKGTKFQCYLMPKASKKALDKYEHNNSPIYSFIDEVFISHDEYDGLDTIERLPMDYLYGVWKSYAKENSYHDVGKNTFNQRVINRLSKILPDENYVIERQRLRAQDAQKISDHRHDDYPYYGLKKFPANARKSCLLKKQK